MSYYWHHGIGFYLWSVKETVRYQANLTHLRTLPFTQEYSCVLMCSNVSMCAFVDVYKVRLEGVGSETIIVIGKGIVSKCCYETVNVWICKIMFLQFMCVKPLVKFLLSNVFVILSFVMLWELRPKLLFFISVAPLTNITRSSFQFISSFYEDPIILFCSEQERNLRNSERKWTF